VQDPCWRSRQRNTQSCGRPICYVHVYLYRPSVQHIQIYAHARPLLLIFHLHPSFESSKFFLAPSLRPSPIASLLSSFLPHIAQRCGHEPRACQRCGAVSHRESGTPASGASAPAAGMPASGVSAPTTGTPSSGEHADSEDAVPCWKRCLSPPNTACFRAFWHLCPSLVYTGLARTIVVFPPCLAVASSPYLAHAAFSSSYAMAVGRPDHTDRRRFCARLFI
jgi:hypothetical protein